MKKLNDFMRGILTEIQELQLNAEVYSFHITTIENFIDVSIWRKRTGRIKGFHFYSFLTEKEVIKELNRLKKYIKV